MFGFQRKISGDLMGGGVLPLTGSIYKHEISRSSPSEGELRLICIRQTGRRAAGGEYRYTREDKLLIAIIWAEEKWGNAYSAL